MRTSLFLSLLVVGAACSSKEADSVKPGDGGNGGNKVPLNRAGGKEGSGGRPISTTMEPRCAAFSPDGKRIAVGFVGSGPYKGPRLKIWEVETGKESNYWPKPPRDPVANKDKAFTDWGKKYYDIDFVSWLPDGKHILTVEGDGMCRIWKSELGELVREFMVQGLGFSTADCKTLLSLSADGFLRVDLGEMLAHQKISSNPVRRTLFSPDGSHASFHYHPSDADPTSLVYWDLQNDKEIRRVKRDAGQRTTLIPFLFSPSGETILAHKREGENWGVVLCDASNLRELRFIRPVASKGRFQIANAVFSPDNKKLLMIDEHLSSDEYPRVDLLDLTTNGMIWTLRKCEEARENQLVAHSPKQDLVLLVKAKRFTAGGLGPGELILMETRRGMVVDRLNTNVFGFE